VLKHVIRNHPEGGQRPGRSQATTTGHPSELFERLRPRCPQLAEALQQFDAIGRSDQQSNRLSPVKLGLDVRGHLNPVDHQITDQALNDGVLHDHPDQPGTSQVTLSELGVGQVLVSESRHPRQYRQSSDILTP
jgi:hypothetical protein